MQIVIDKEALVKILKVSLFALTGADYAEIGETVNELLDKVGYTILPEHSTNGDMIESIFQHTEYNKYVKKIVCATTVMKEWWNKPYKAESEEI